MIDVARGLAALVAGLAAVPVWFAPGPASSAIAQGPDVLVRIQEDEDYDECTFRFVSEYRDDGTQRVLTKQVWEEDVCTFGGRRGSIRVRVCFADPEDGSPVDCSEWLMPTSVQPSAESVITTPAPRGSIHYFKISGTSKRFDLPAPELPPSPSPEPDPPQDQPSEPSSAPTAPPTDDPGAATTGPATTGPPAGGGSEPEIDQPERTALPPRSDNRPGLAVVLATGGAALLGLGAGGIWLLRRSGSGSS